MSGIELRRGASVAAFLFALALPAAVVAGPPWISIETPTNPNDPATRDALVTVRTYHHGSPRAFALSAVAEGIVDGARRTLPLDVAQTGARGVYAVRGALPRGTAWVLVVTLRERGEPAATALVALDAEGAISGVEVPSRPLEGGRWAAPRPATSADVDRLLRTAEAVSDARRSAAIGGIDPAPALSLALAGLGVALLIPIGRRAAGRRRRPPRGSGGAGPA